MEVDYEKIGLKIGLEIHQQLDTRTKLFCDCPTILRGDDPDMEVVRKLRVTQSELGEIDPAAKFEFEKGKYFVYQAYNDTNCLVELDEEPPHMINMEAVEICLMIAKLLNSNPVDEIHVMRKIVIDGSNTSGFQRTCIVALGGYVEDYRTGEVVGIQTICLEEDAARKISEDEKSVTYRLDRLGIPLIEIATSPHIKTPEQARRIALRIGQLLRATGMVKRGIGTIRQDVNLSIKDGAFVEIKGVQYLDQIEKVIRNEVMRQVNLLKIREMIREKGIKKDEIKEDYFDVTDRFKDTKSKIISKALKRGNRVYALKIPKFKGLLGMELQKGYRFGTELSEYVRFWTGLKGLFHSDELPAYGISEEELKEVMNAANADREDAVIIIASDPKKIDHITKVIVDRIKIAFEKVPEETRRCDPDGLSRYLRPRPGSARMYPETDVPYVPLTKEILERVEKVKIELPEEKIDRIVKKYKLSEKIVWEMFEDDLLWLFEEIVEKTGAKASVVASTLAYDMKSLKREGVPVENISRNKLIEIFSEFSKGNVVKEAIPQVIRWLSQHPEMDLKDAIEELGLKKVGISELEEEVEKVIRENEEMISQRGERAFGPLMGILMKKFRGKVDGAIVSKVLREKLNSLLNSKKPS
ncbi:MAG: Glu-tRNA(Gln) amidotransferase subunit GatE [Candidatus Asgardarchaeia archaeon]